MSGTAYVEGVWDFLELGRNELQKLERAIESGDTLSVRSCTEGLITQAGSLGLGDIVRCAEEVKRAAYQCSLTGTVISYQQLRVSLDGLKKDLGQAAAAG